MHHAFPDTQGSLLDGSGNFRVLLHITNPDGSEMWGAQPVVVAQRVLPAVVPSEESVPATSTSVRTIHVPAEGGYTFTLLAAQSATISIDNLPPVHTPKMRPQVCGATGYARQPTRISAALAAGTHRLIIEWAPVAIRQACSLEPLNHRNSSGKVPEFQPRLFLDKCCRDFTAGEISAQRSIRDIRPTQLASHGGEGGIRTPDSLATMPDFESGAFNRALPPLRIRKPLIANGFCGNAPGCSIVSNARCDGKKGKLSCYRLI